MLSALLLIEYTPLIIWWLLDIYELAVTVARLVALWLVHGLAIAVAEIFVYGIEGFLFIKGPYLVDGLKVIHGRFGNVFAVLAGIFVVSAGVWRMAVRENWEFTRLLNRFFITVFLFHIGAEAISIFIILVNVITLELYPGTQYGMTTGAAIFTQLLYLTPAIFGKLALGVLAGPIHLLLGAALYLALGIRYMYVNVFYVMYPLLLPFIIVDKGIFNIFRQQAYRLFTAFLFVSIGGILVAAVLSVGEVLVTSISAGGHITSDPVPGVDSGTYLHTYAQTYDGVIRKEDVSGPGGTLSSQSTSFFGRLFAQLFVFYGSILIAIGISVLTLPLGMSIKVQRHIKKMIRRTERYFGLPPLDYHRSRYKHRAKVINPTGGMIGDTEQPDNTVIYEEYDPYLEGEQKLPYDHPYYNYEDELSNNPTFVTTEDIEEELDSISLDAQVVSVFEPNNENIDQIATLMDEHGTVTVINYADSGIPELVEGGSYYFDGVATKVEDDGEVALELLEQSNIRRIDPEVSATPATIDEIQEMGDNTKVSMKVDVLSTTESDSVTSLGTIEDESGRIRFMRIENGETGPELTEGGSYRIEGAVTDSHDGDRTITITGMANIDQLDEPAVESVEKTVSDVTNDDLKITTVADVVELRRPDHEKIEQVATLRDGSGEIELIKWAGTDAPDLVQGQSYALEGARTYEDDSSVSLMLGDQTEVTPIDSRVTPDKEADIADLSADQVQVAVEADVVSTFSPNSESISQIVTLRDETGDTTLVKWAGASDEIFSKGDTYRIQQTAPGEYNGDLNLYLDDHSQAIELTERVTDVAKTDIANVSTDQIDVEFEADVISVTNDELSSIPQKVTLQDSSGKITLENWEEETGVSFQKGESYRIHKAVPIDSYGSERLRLGEDGNVEQLQERVLNSKDKPLEEVTPESDGLLAVDGTVTDSFSPSHPNVEQVGTISDGSNDLDFVVFDELDQDLEEFESYRFNYVESTEYDGRTQIVIGGASAVKSIEGEHVSIPVEETEIGELTRDKHQVSVEGDVVSASESPHHGISQHITLKDNTGTVNLVSWEDGADRWFVEGETYRITKAVPDYHDGATTLLYGKRGRVEHLDERVVDSREAELSDIDPDTDGQLSVEGTVEEVFSPSHAGIEQVGRLSDGSESIDFVIYEGSDQRVNEGEEYQFNWVEASEYQGSRQIVANTTSRIQPPDGQRDPVTDINPGEVAPDEGRLTVSGELIEAYESPEEGVEMEGILAGEDGWVHVSDQSSRAQSPLTEFAGNDDNEQVSIVRGQAGERADGNTIIRLTNESTVTQYAYAQIDGDRGHEYQVESRSPGGSESSDMDAADSPANQDDPPSMEPGQPIRSSSDETIARSPNTSADTDGQSVDDGSSSSSQDIERSDNVDTTSLDDIDEILQDEDGTEPTTPTGSPSNEGEQSSRRQDSSPGMDTERLYRVPEQKSTTIRELGTKAVKTGWELKKEEFKLMTAPAHKTVEQAIQSDAETFSRLRERFGNSPATEHEARFRDYSAGYPVGTGADATGDSWSTSRSETDTETENTTRYNDFDTEGDRQEHTTTAQSFTDVSTSRESQSQATLTTDEAKKWTTVVDTRGRTGVVVETDSRTETATVLFPKRGSDIANESIQDVVAAYDRGAEFDDADERTYRLDRKHDWNE